MINLRPRELFMADDEEVKRFNDMAHSRTMQIALALAVTQFAQETPTNEEMKGVERFIRLFLNIGQKIDAPKMEPFKSIASSLPAREQPPTPKK